MPGCWKDWNGLGEVTEVTAFWGEGIGRNSHTLKLQELGGFPKQSLAVGVLTVLYQRGLDSEMAPFAGCGDTFL